MSLKALSDYTFYSRYSRYLPEKQRRETWGESVKRVFDMHRQKYAEAIKQFPELAGEIDFAERQQKKKRILAAQRSLQFAGAPILKHELKIYNCSATHCDRPDVFSEIMYVLLCGCGVGFSVQKQHVDHIPEITSRETEFTTYTIEDSIEGWADSIGVLMNSYFTQPSERFAAYKGKKILFDYSQIRPEGALIAGQFKAPGPMGLRDSIIKITKLLDDLLESGITKLRPIHVYDILMHISNAVLSGGVRRSATICLFSVDDDEMMNAKTGDWFIKNPQRARSNNSAALLKGHVSREQFAKLMKSTKEFGEPGFIWLNDLDIIFNPCTEIALYPKLTKDSISTFQGCNLSEINGKFCDTEENFLQACRASAIIGTLQAGYVNFKYLPKEAEEVFRRESLLGSSITGMMDNPEIIFNAELQRKGAEEIKRVNAKIADMIGIPHAARTTCVKPAGCGIPSTEIKTVDGVKTYNQIFEANGYILDNLKDKENLWLSVNTDIFVQNENNKPEKITRLYINGYAEVYDIPLSDNTILTLTGNHKVKLASGEWRRVDELVAGDDILKY